MILLAPGPVFVPERIEKAQCKEMITHRSQEFTDLYTNLIERFKGYTSSYDAHILTGSGTLGLETLITNLTKPEDNVLALSNGVFGDKLAKIAGIHANVEKHSLPAGQGWNLEKSKEIIDESDADVFVMVYNETGYGIMNHSKDIVLYAKKRGMRTILDIVSGWPGVPFDMKEFKLDGFGTASQKGSATPPGLAMIGLSEEATQFIDSRESIPSFYMNLQEYRKRYKKVGQTPFTPAISLMWALQESFNMLDERGGINKAVEITNRWAAMVRTRLKKIGFELIPEFGFESPTVTAFKSTHPKQIIEEMKNKGYTIVGCKGAFADTGLRIAHMGYIGEERLTNALDTLENIVGEIGI